MQEFNKTLCEVCHKPVGDVALLPPEIQEMVYRPSEDETYNVEVDLSTNGKEIFGEDE